MGVPPLYPIDELRARGLGMAIGAEVVGGLNEVGCPKDAGPSEGS